MKDIIGELSDGMIAWDATSLYPAAMKTLLSVPDLTTY